MVMECDRDLNQSLQESLFGSRRSPPHVFQDFVRFKELGFVEELNSAKKGFLIHPAIVARGAGTVEDPQGAVLTGAKVTAKHLATNRGFDTVTGAGGTFSLRNLPPGAYDVKVEAPN